MSMFVLSGQRMNESLAQNEALEAYRDRQNLRNVSRDVARSAPGVAVPPANIYDARRAAMPATYQAPAGAPTLLAGVTPPVKPTPPARPGMAPPSATAPAAPAPRSVTSGPALNTIGGILTDLSKPDPDHPGFGFAAFGLGHPRDIEAFRGAQTKASDRSDAQRWFNTTEAYQLISSNPALAAKAKADPIAFYKAAQTGQFASQQVPKTKAPTTPVAEVAAPTTTAGAVETKAGREREVAAPTTTAGVAKDGPVAAAVTKTKTKLKEPKRMMPTLLNKELQAGQLAYRQALQIADIYQRAGIGEKYLEARMAAERIALTVQNLAGQKAANLLEKANDPRLLMQLWSQQYGQNVVLRPRSDGKWNIEVDGQLVNEGVTTSKLVSVQRASLSSAWVTSVNAAATKHAAERDKAVWDLRKTELGKWWDNLTARQKAKLEAEGKIIKDTETGVWRMQDGRPIHYIPGEREPASGEGPPVPTVTPVVPGAAAGTAKYDPGPGLVQRIGNAAGSVLDVLGYDR